MSKPYYKPQYNVKVAVAVVQDNEGRVLIVKRKQDVESIDGGKLSWVFPGGAVPIDKSVKFIAESKTLSKSGYKIKVKSEISNRTYHPFNNHLTYFDCELVDKNPEEPTSDGVEGVLWVEPQVLNNYLTTSIDSGVAKFLGI